MCQSDGENFIVSRGSHFVDGTRCESDSSPPFGTTAACLQGRCEVKTASRSRFCSAGLTLLMFSVLSVISCLAVMGCCTLEKRRTFVGCVTEMGRPAA